MESAEPERTAEGPKKKLLRRKEAAQYVREEHNQPCSFQYLAKLAVIGGGPKYRLCGRNPLYDPAHLDEWAGNRLSGVVSSTSEYSVAA